MKYGHLILDNTNHLTPLVLALVTYILPTAVWAVDPIIPIQNQAALQSILNDQREAEFRRQQDQKSREHATEIPPLVTPTETAVQMSVSDTASCFTINQIYLQGKLAHRFSWAVSDAIVTKERVSVRDIVRADIEPQCLGAVDQ